MNVYLEVTLSNNISQRYNIKGKVIYVGTSNRCQVVLPKETKLYPEHFTITPNQKGCIISLKKEVSIPIKHLGQGFREKQIAWGEDIYVGNICIQPNMEKKDVYQKIKVLAIMIIIIIITLITVLYLLWDNSSDHQSQLDHLKPPPLFYKAVKCTRPENAYFRAKEAEREGNAKIERYPFNAKDGVEAVRLIEEAQMCYQRSGNIAETKKLKIKVMAWRDILNRDYQRHILDLRMALKKNRVDKAIKKIIILRELLYRHDNNNITWLNQLERQLVTEGTTISNVQL